MKVKQLMTKEVATCRSSDNLQKAAQVMWELDCGCVPITDEESQVVGMLTDRDICMAASMQGRTLGEIPISSVMSTELYSCTPQQEVSAAENLMETKQVRRLPVIDRKQHLQGLLSLNDIATMAAREEDKAAKDRQVNYSEVGHTMAAICEPRRTRTQAA
jgi:CBS domain-containing protein